jgi:hypothetical protein
LMKSADIPIFAARVCSITGNSASQKPAAIQKDR